jgi:hypothetical protein
MKTPSCRFNQMLGKMKILSMDVRTALAMEEPGERLKAFFGKEGLGLEWKGDDRGRITSAVNHDPDRGPMNADIVRPAQNVNSDTPMCDA